MTLYSISPDGALLPVLIVLSACDGGTPSARRPMSSEDASPGSEPSLDMGVDGDATSLMDPERVEDPRRPHGRPV